MHLLFSVNKEECEENLWDLYLRNCCGANLVCRVAMYEGIKNLVEIGTIVFEL